MHAGAGNAPSGVGSKGQRPDDFELRDGKFYAVMKDGETTFKRFRANPARLEPCSSNPAHGAIAIGREPFTVIGRVVGTWRDFD